MKRVVGAVLAGVIAGVGLVPAGAVQKEPTETTTAANAVASVFPKKDEWKYINGPGKFLLQKKESGTWRTKKTQKTKFEGGWAYGTLMTLNNGNVCRLIAKFLGNDKYAGSKAAPYKVNCKSGASV